MTNDKTEDWVNEWEKTVGFGTGAKSIGRLVKDVDKAERADMRNRLLSIFADAQFVADLLKMYRAAGCQYPLFANLRNGLWYGHTWDGTCYFKSTDGHSLSWSFSYTRFNIHLAAAAAEAGGCIVVDSTRSGKRFPDSFTATVPIWCTVINRLVAEGNPEGKEWDTDLHTPSWLSPSEGDQIRQRLDGWVEGLGRAKDALRNRLKMFLHKPLRPLWLCPDSCVGVGTLPAADTTTLPFTPIICVSASKIISREAHRQHHSWVYVQGAGDDEEHWCRGLTPKAFWDHSEALVYSAMEKHEREGFDETLEAILGELRQRQRLVRRGGVDKEMGMEGSTENGNRARSKEGCCLVSSTGSGCGDTSRLPWCASSQNGCDTGDER
ncbi:unnamed protein product, partial [Choristocarpus tenellus]